MCDPADARIAPAVQQLTTVATRVNAVWARLGVSELDRQHRWDTFVQSSLLPYIRDFCTAQEAAEYNAATENDVLLREVCYLATRLDEVPRDGDVAAVVALLKRHYTRTPMASPLLASHRKAAAARLTHEGSSTGDDAEKKSRHASVSSSDVRQSQRSSKELMFLTLPSFTDLLTTATKGAAADNEEDEKKVDDVVVKVEMSAKSSLSVAAAEKVEWMVSEEDEQAERAAEELEFLPCDEVGNEEGGSEGDDSAETVVTTHQHCVTENGTAEEKGNEEAAVMKVDCAARLSTKQAASAIRHLMASNTHEGVRQQLQAELDRLSALANNRLRVLQLLCKQRALLTRSAAEQVMLRAAYRVKYLGDAESRGTLRKLLPPLASDSPDSESVAAVIEVLKETPITSSNNINNCSSVEHNVAVGTFVGNGVPIVTKDISVSPPTSSHFLSLPPSPKSSLNSLHAASSTESGRGSKAAPFVQQQKKKDTPPVSAAISTEVRCSPSTTQAELDLLLSAASCTLDAPSTWDNSDATADRYSAEGSAFTNPTVHTAGPSSSSASSSFFFDARSTQATTACPQPTCSSASSVSGRPTVFDVDVSSITAFGTHQELTLRRIQQEADSILQAIADHNRQMQTKAEEELRALEVLDVLWRAMSAQRTSPKPSASPSLSLVSPTANSTEAPESNVPSTSADTAAAAATAVAAASVNVGVTPDPVVASLQPAPFAETRDEVMAHYEALRAAFVADVAAQKASHDSHDGTSLQARKSGDLYLPPAVRQVLRAASFAPVLDYVHRTRVAFQRHLSTQQDALVEKVMRRLRDVYATYHAATGDSAYAVAPDGELRVAMEEELLESLQQVNNTNDSNSSSGDSVSTLPGVGGSSGGENDGNHRVYADDETTATRTKTGATSAVALSAFASSDKALLSFQRHLTACQQVREQAADEIEFLRLRLHILDEAAPLVRDYVDILREEAEMQANSRERLLSKKVNMAKQLLQEEKVRRRVAKELPRIVAHLTELVAAWDALQAATDPREDTADGVPPAKSELCVHGRRVRDLLTSSSNTKTNTSTASRAGTSTAANSASSRTRPRSVSSRSVSPAVPAHAKPRTEPHATTRSRSRDVAGPQHRASPAIPSSRRATPSPPPPPSASSPHPRTFSRSPSHTSSMAVAAPAPADMKHSAPTARPITTPLSTSPVHAFTQPTRSPKPRGPPVPPLVPSVGLRTRVRSLSPGQRSGLSPRPVNAPEGRGKSTSPSAAVHNASHPAPFSTYSKPAH